MDGFIIVIRKDPKVRIKINDLLVRYTRLSLSYQPKIGYDALIQNVNLKELINIMGTTITGLDMDLRIKISRIQHLECKNSI